MILERVKMISLLIGMVLLLHLGIVPTHAQDLGTIAGMAVSKQEVQREMHRYRSEVYNLVASKNKSVVNGTTSWQTEKVDGLKGIDILRNKALDSLAVIKVQEKLLKERGLWPYKTYPEFLKDLNKTNENRRSAVGKGEVMYGPVQYLEQTFFDYRLANAVIQLKLMLVEEKLITITEEDLQKQFSIMQKTVYKSEKATLKEFRRQVTEAYIEEAYKSLTKGCYQKAKRELDMDKTNQINLTS